MAPQTPNKRTTPGKPGALANIRLRLRSPYFIFSAAALASSRLSYG